MRSRHQYFKNILGDCNAPPGLKATGLISWEEEIRSGASCGPDRRHFTAGVRHWVGKRSILAEVSKPRAWAEEVQPHAVAMCFFPGSV